MVDAQEWLDKKYPLEERNKIIDLDIAYKRLEGSLEFTGFVNLKKLYCNNNQLTNYKIWGGGYTIFFPDLDEDIPVRIFTDGLGSPCCC